MSGHDRAGANPVTVERLEGVMRKLAEVRTTLRHYARMSDHAPEKWVCLAQMVGNVQRRCVVEMKLARDRE